jgi:hypothetical protein
MKAKLALAIALLALSGCGTPAGDIVAEIMDAGRPVIGKQIILKTSPSLKSGSLGDASEIWFASGWKQGQPALCKEIAPQEWTKAEAFTTEYWYSDKSKDQIYDILLCATQLNDPKRVGAIGVVTASRKPEPIKP